MPQARCTKTDQMRPVMTSEGIKFQVSPGNGAEPAFAAEARLAAELAAERHVALELQRAILPLHDEPFELPGLYTMVRYLPASRAGRVGGDW